MMNDKPNILFIIAEQQRGDCLGVEGHPVLQTPNLDGIAARGVRFSRFYSACPSCIAARRSILCGQSPQTHGIVGYRESTEWDPPTTLPQALRDNGYQTWIVGRSMHQHPPRRRLGYDDMELFLRRGSCDYAEWLNTVGPKDSGGWFGGGVMHNDWTAKPWHLDEHLHHTNWTVSRALRFLERRDPSCPFFLTVSFIAAHPPLQPPAFYLERYLRTGVPDPVIGDWAEPPESGRDRSVGDLVSAHKVNLTGEALLSARAGYYGLINHMDDQLRRLINPVVGIDKLTGRNTIIVFTSDHGEMLGDHYMWRKSVAYEPSARVPFLAAAPDRFGLKQSSVVDLPATHADIMPTLLDMAGIDIPDTVEGQSLLPLMQGRETPWREYLHIEHAPRHQALTDGREKYIWSPSDGREQLFDLTHDPNECSDLAGSPECADRLAGWRASLLKELKDRPEDFTDGKRLIPGRPYRALMVEPPAAPA